MERATKTIVRRLRASLVAPLLLLLCCAVVGCGGGEESASSGPTPQAVEGPTGVRIRAVPGVPQIAAGLPDASGGRAQVSCSTCHSLKQPAPQFRRGEELQKFHQGMHVQHGNLSCLSCHNADDYDTLRLANGERVTFERVMDLCAQCHGTQARDYAHGAHGGMSGYWDASRGEQVRNQCTHCHAPHAPAYPHMRPTFKPRDRFLSPHQESHDD